MMFGGLLPPLPIRLGKARTRLGSLGYSVRRRLFRKRELFNFHMRFSTLFDLPQNVWEDIIIHEMIHYHLALTRQQDRTPHGPNFRRMMKDINERYGREVRISIKAPHGFNDIRQRVANDRSITDFQRRVYLELLKVPKGTVITYGELARRIGCRSAQAVGQALRKNPFAPEVPCHRVVARDGSLHGFCGSSSPEALERKRRLLEEEKDR